jgi:hypothetical protein
MKKSELYVVPFRIARRLVISWVSDDRQKALFHLNFFTDSIRFLLSWFTSAIWMRIAEKELNLIFGEDMLKRIPIINIQDYAKLFRKNHIFVLLRLVQDMRNEYMIKVIKVRFLIKDAERYHPRNCECLQMTKYETKRNCLKSARINAARSLFGNFPDYKKSCMSITPSRKYYLHFFTVIEYTAPRP